MTAKSFVAATAILCAALSSVGQILPPNLTHRYNFSGNANDSVAGSNGTLFGAATITNGALVLTGSSGTYLDLPDNLFSNYNSMSVEAWVTDNGSGAWARIYDFNAGTARYMFLTLPGGSGNLRSVIATNSSAEQITEWVGNRPPAGTKFHVVTVLDSVAQVGRIYVNGTMVGSNLAVTATPALLSPATNTWLGRSPFGADPYFNGTIDEFRTYDIALDQATISQNFAAGPDKFLVGPVYFVAQPQPTNVLQSYPVTFFADVDGTAPFTFQWYRNGNPIPGETNNTLNFIAATTNNNDLYSLRATNSYLGTNYSAISSNALLTVTPDTNPPVLLSAQGMSTNGFRATFSEPVLPSTGTNLANYTLTGPSGVVAINSATLDPNGAEVIFTTANLLVGSNYTVTVSGVRDFASNLIAAASQASFVAAPFILDDVGSPAISGAFNFTSNGLVLTGAGTNIGGSNDQFSFAYEFRTNDFDIQVRIGSLGLVDPWTLVGLMARDGLTTNAPFAATFATPGQSGCFFESRLTTNAVATTSGSFPVNYPNTWLRLKRVGNVFTGYASLDGQTWYPLGSATITASSALQVGLAICSKNAGQAASTSYATYGNTVSATVASQPLPFEPLGPSSRASGLVISEIMYHPPGNTNFGSLEFIELYNSDLIPEDLTGYRLSGSIDYSFPPGTSITNGGFLVIARDPAAVQSYYGITGVLGPYTNNLPNGSGTVRLRNEFDSVLFNVDYDSKAPWPVGPDGAGHSLVLSRPSYGENDPHAWGPSYLVGGSPGRPEPWTPDPYSALMINEFLAHTDLPDVDTIEIFNSGTTSINVAGCILTDDPTTNKFVLPNLVIPARGFAYFTEAQLGFNLNAAGESIYLKNPSLTRVVDAIKFDAQENGVSFGRYPDGSDQWYRLTSRTFGSSNATPLISQVVINELMYNPLSGLDDDQYVELFNRGTNAVNLSGWSFVAGIDYTFPTNTSIPANGYLVVAKNAARLMSNYVNLNITNTLGDFGGKLSHSGERVALAMPDTIATTNGPNVTTNLIAIAVDEVTYGVGGRWGQWADGGGSSLELIDPRSDKRFFGNWADSDETAKSQWTLIERTALLQLGMGTGTNGNGNPNRFEVTLQGAGECLIDNAEVHTNGTATNLISNPDFESGTNGWVFQGTHEQTSLETNLSGFAGTNSLHIRATQRGDTGANRVRTAIPQLPVNGTNQATIRLRARWLRGDTNILFRIRGNWLECSGAMTPPLNLGTPGLPNSRLIANAGPAIRNVSHFPVLPEINAPVTVTAQVSDPDGISSVTLFYRIDPSPTYSSVAMTDNGTGADAVAGDGIYSASISTAGAVLAAFYVQAQDANGSPASATFPASGECLVRFGDPLPAANMGVYRMWLTTSNITYWTGREKNSNKGIDTTFIYGNSRIIYNAQTRYGGSPWHTPGYTGPLGTGAAVCNYDLLLPPDNLFLGTEECNLESEDFADHTTFNNDATAQAETTAHWMARKIGIRPDYRRYVSVYMNAQRRGLVYFDYQQPNGDLLKEYFPDDSNGKLHKIEDWFEFDDNGAGQNIITAKLLNNVVNGQKRTERYRWNFRPRSTESPNDFSDLFALVDAVNAPNPDPYTSAVENLVDMRKWMRMFAMEHMTGDWDSYGYRRGKNMYAYKPDNSRWELLLWDIQQVMSKGSDGTNQSLFDVGNTNDATLGDPLIVKMYNHPPFVREYWSAFQDLVNGPMQPSSYGPIMDARVAALKANGIAVTSTTGIKNWIAGRRAFILNQIPQAAFSVSGTNSFSSSSNRITVTGIAPIGADKIVVNGAAYPITWTTVTNWSLSVALGAGTNALNIQALDFNGNVLSNSVINVNYTGPSPSPIGNVVISEIMHHPAVDGAEYVELFNNHTNYTFDLSGWRMNGLSYTFPPGSIIQPRQFLVLARDPAAFAVAYGVVSNGVYDHYDGNLQSGGETLTLIKPGSQTPTNDITVTKVRYETNAPWPVGALQPGTSLQLVDTTRDNWRAGNWGVGSTNVIQPAPQWVFVSANGTASSSILYMYLQSAGDIYIDDVKLVAGNVPEVGVNTISNGDFETTLTGPWSVSADFAGSVRSTNFAHSGSNSLHMVATATGSGNGDSIQQTISPALTTNAAYTLSFWYLQTTNGGPLTLRLSSSGVTTTVSNLAPPVVVPTLTATPGASNSIATNLTAFQPLWINEVEPQNISGITNSAGGHTPWIEIYNPTSNTVSLSNLYLTKNYSNLTSWSFPTNAVVNPGQFKVVFADGLTNLSTTNQLHANFTLIPGAGSVGLSRVVSNQTQVLDYINYSNIPQDRSFGSFPDGQAFDRQQFFFVTPGATNNGSNAPITVFINEWMADNTHTLADPADSQFEDWFEIYNPTTNAADLGGYYLTDNLTNKFQYLIPNNGQYVVPPHGFLLVWADNESGQNASNRADLHANFALSKSGEAIGLFAPDGTAVDFVSFGAQTSDVSQGRYPDGGPLIYTLNTASPRTNNFFANSAPTLAPIANRVITLGQTLSFTVTGAADIDAPPQSLSFSVPTPPSASINSVSGLLNWTPVTAPVTNSFQVVVADNGTPFLSATQFFQVTVVPPPSIISPSVTGNQFSFGWQSVAGTQYQLVYKGDLLLDPNWIPIGSPIVGNGLALSVTNTVVSGTNRFFTLQILP